jgi:uncharacterized protein YtpQ (UPF0354 family)
MATKLEMTLAINEYIKDELTEDNWRGTWDLFWRTIDCGLDRARNLVEAFLNEDFEKIAKRMKVAELEAILSVLASKRNTEETETTDKVTVEEDTKSVVYGEYIPPCDGCGKYVYPAVYRTQSGCCDVCCKRIFDE